MPCRDPECHAPRDPRAPLRWRAGAALLLLAGLAPSQLRAEPETPPSAAEMVENARDYYGVRQSIHGCHSAALEDEVVVCGRRAPDPRYEQVSAPRAPDAKTIALGAPPAGRGVGAGVVMRGCFLQKCPKELYFIDLASIPEPAPGSDADKISKGEMRAR